MRLALALLSSICLAAAPAAAATQYVVDADNSRGLKAGDSVVSGTKVIGEVEDVGFGDKDTVEVRIAIDPDHDTEIRESSTFVIEEVVGNARPKLEHYVLDPAAPKAAPGKRFHASGSIAEVWLRRGRISAEELSKAMNQGVGAMRRNLERLQSSKEWAKFKDQIARLSAELTVTGASLALLLDEQLPKLQQELDGLYEQYQQELERARPTPTP